ncbi:MAG: hypothetical protein QOF41_2093, partial [Methylobacteriaceae bacterium]|nr:hypothetical protein [Methylobacteriaceae bacterium]
MRDARLPSLLAGAGSRLRIAALVVVVVWSAVMWAVLAPDAPPASEPAAMPPAMRLVVAA